MLIDQFGRHINYIRISVTDRCDLRCRYCMNEDMTFLPRSQILSLEEIERLASVFVAAGVKKIRITGGEPLVRKGIVDLLERLAKLKQEGLQELVMTSNATNLENHAQAIYEAGVDSLNISLDSLQEERFASITRVGDLSRVLRGIEAARKYDFKSIKLNAVLMRGFNEDEIFDLVDFAIARGLDISFIEEMPLGEIQHDRALSCVSSDEIEANIRTRYQLEPLKRKEESTAGPARIFKLSESSTKLGLISPHSHNFCGDCNRVRLTAEGRLLLCLGNEHSVDFRDLLREKACSNEQLLDAFRQSLDLKPEKHEFDLHDAPQIVRFMNMTGG